MPDGPADRASNPSALSSKPEWVKVGPGGRIVIPVAMRRALGLGEGEHVQARLVDGELRLVPRDLVCRRIQEEFAEHVPGDASLVDELIEERRREALREARGE